METEIAALAAVAQFAFLHKFKRTIPLAAVPVDEPCSPGRPQESAETAPQQHPLDTPDCPAEGYVFPWGHIVERRIERVIAWEFCFDALLRRDHSHHRGLQELQRVLFDRLVQDLPEWVETDLLSLASLDTGWRIYPGMTLGGFTVVAHFYWEDDARRWVADTLMTARLPEFIAAAVVPLDRVGQGSR